MEIQDGRLALSGRRRNQPRPALLLQTILLGLGVIVGRAAPAHADGAFPASQSVLLPRDRPNEIVLATTFGLLFTEDNGASWRYSCETNATFNGRQYIMGPAPDDRIYAVSDRGAPVTDDGACTWTLGGGAIVDVQSFGDVFPDPSDVTRTFALARPASETGDNPAAATAVYRSMDEGLTYSGPLFAVHGKSEVTGIEVAASAPSTVYSTFYDVSGDVMTGFVVHPRLARSDDGGDTWTTMDLDSALGAVRPRLAAVDPTDPNRVYLLLISAPTDPNPLQGVAITTDGGGTWSVPLLLKGAGAALAGFVRLPDETLVAVGLLAGPTSSTGIPTAFHSTDAGKTFTSEPLPFHPVGLAHRDGTLFVSTNNTVDGYALASSDDGGHSWRSRLKFRDVSGVTGCVFSSCQASCDFLAGETLWPPETCNPAPDAGPSDGSNERARSPGSGCGCGLGVGKGKNRPAVMGIAAFLIASVVGRRRRRGQRGLKGDSR